MYPPTCAHDPPQDRRVKGPDGDIGPLRSRCAQIEEQLTRV
ncbi:conserved domain protein [Actinomyces sp. oral taxon 170 str. F0386]|nr:conserved domain protein [Actinomyces sp. oral taxon 170 str. F0386]